MKFEQTSNMRVLATHPGRYGDLLWALPTVRELATTFRCQVDLLLSPHYSDEHFQSLLRRQIYIGDVSVCADWEIYESAPITPRIPPNVPPGYDRVVHLAYDGWPERTLPRETYRIALDHVPQLLPLNLATPWIAAPVLKHGCVAVGFSAEHYELKFGLLRLLQDHLGRRRVLNVSGGARWATPEQRIERNWEVSASLIAGAPLFVGCCSGLHVLACALKVPVLLVEPASARHHDVFYPFGKLGPEVTLLTGGDGLPTVDSRHLCEAIDERLTLTRVEAT